jgi:hypothetical protein
VICTTTCCLPLTWHARCMFGWTHLNATTREMQFLIEVTTHVADLLLNSLHAVTLPCTCGPCTCCQSSASISGTNEWRHSRLAVRGDLEYDSQNMNPPCRCCAVCHLLALPFAMHLIPSVHCLLAHSLPHRQQQKTATPHSPDQTATPLQHLLTCDTCFPQSTDSVLPML